MIDIFIDTDQQEFWLAQGLPDKENYQIFRNMDFWHADNGHKKLALVELLSENDITDKQLELLCQHADQVLLFIPELINQNWLNQFDLPNVTIYVAGKLNTVETLLK